MLSHLAEVGGQRLHRLHEDFGAVAVVAEHVQAGAGRAQQHRVAGRGLLEAPARRRFERLRGAAAARARPPSAAVSGSRPARSLRRRGRSSRPRAHGGAAARASGAKSWPLPSPPRITTSRAGALVAAQPVDRGDGGADVGALAVVEGVDAADAWRRTAGGAARRRSRAAHAASAPAGSRSAVGQRQRRQRIGGVVAAAHAQRIGRHHALDEQFLVDWRRRAGRAAASRRHPAHAPARPCRFRRPGRSRRAGAAHRGRSGSTRRALGAAPRRPLRDDRRRHHRLDQRVVAVDDHHGRAGRRTKMRALAAT